MFELPESAVLARQLNETVKGKSIVSAVANASPHKFAWYGCDPNAYGDMVNGRKICGARAVGGYVLLEADDATMYFHDGVNLRYLAPNVPAPVKHQLLLSLSDGSHLYATVSMYGGLDVYTAENDNPYYVVARDKPSPMTEAFDEAYFDALVSESKPSLSAKALLATEQRIPGLGNGVLQDILFHAHIAPMKKTGTMTDADRENLFASIKTQLSAMFALGGRNTENDLLGVAGDYRTLRTCPACPVCGGLITRKAYLGGHVYYCAHCQQV